jgi:hypothetical protein
MRVPPFGLSILLSMRLLRFNLRVTLVVTAIVAYVAWHVGMVQQRKTAMKGMHVFVLDSSGTGVNPIRALLGDEPVRYVYIVPLGDHQRDTLGLLTCFPRQR